MKYLAIMILLLPSFLQAAAVDADWKVKEFNDFSFGLNTQKDEGNLDSKESPNIQNGYVDEKPFSLVGRNGMAIAGSCPFLSKINFGFEQVFDDGSRKLYVSDSSQVFVTSDLITWTLVKSTLTTTAMLSAVQGRGFVLFTNGSDPVFISSGLVAIPLDGTNGRPNVPRGKYGAFNQERFFVGNTTSNTSALNFMALSSTAGYIIPIDDPLAWPIVNQLNIGQGDGSVISGLDVFSGQLQVHKNNRAIYTIFGTDETNYFARKTNANSGTVSNRSITQLDNIEYFFEKEGVRAFDGQSSLRISDDIFPDMESVASNLTNIVDKTYDSDAEFSAWTLANSTTIGNGYVLINSTITTEAIKSVYTDNASWGGTLVSASSVTGFHTLSTDTFASGLNFSGFITSVTVFAKSGGVCTANDTASVIFKNSRTNQVVETSTVTFTEASTPNKYTFPITGAFNFTNADIQAGRISVQLEMQSLTGTCNYSASSFTVPAHGVPDGSGGGAFYKASTNTAAWLSDITTATNISIWDTFDAAANTGGGNITYFIKAATSLIQMPGERWTAIMPGSIIPFNSSRTFVQVMATMSAINLDVTTNTYIDRISIQWNQGGVTDSSPAGIEWKKRYWLLVATSPAGTVTPIYVKSRTSNAKPNAWTVFTFSNDYFKSIFKFNDNLYLGSGSTATIYRMDYGTNDNGYPIHFYYETPASDMGTRWFKKNQYEYLLDADKVSGANLTIKTSVDGAAFSTNTISVSLNGSGNLTRSIKSTNIPKIGRNFKYALENFELDKQITIHGFGIFYEQTLIRD